MNTLPDDVKNLIKAIINEDGHNLSTGSLKSLRMIEEYAKAYAPVPGKEERLNNDGQKYLNEAEKLLYNWLDLYKKYANDNPSEDMLADATDEALQFFKSHKDTLLTTNEPKAVQQAAEKYGLDNCKSCNDRGYSDPCTCSQLENAFLAGASFNKDAVEFLNWVFENGYVYNTEDGYLWLNDVPYLVDETYSVFKQNNIQQAHDKAQYE